jgi:hypothetical protein
MKLKSLLIIGSSTILLASCLKSKDSLGLINDKGSIVTEIADVNVYGDLKPIALSATPPTETFTLLTLKSYAPRSNKPAGNTVHVKLVLDNNAVTSIPGLTVLPPSAYTIPSLELDVPSSGEVSLPITLNKNAMDLSKSYGLGFKISEVNAGVISDLAKSIVINILVKNKYDGRYELRGFHNRPTFEAPYDEEVHLITTGASSVKMYWPAAGKDAHPIAGGTTYYSAFTTEFIFNGSDALTGVNNTYTPGSPAFTVGPATDSRYVPASKTIYAQYYYNANLQRMFTDTLVYIGPR